MACKKASDCRNISQLVPPSSCPSSPTPTVMMSPTPSPVVTVTPSSSPDNLLAEGMYLINFLLYSYILICKLFVCIVFVAVEISFSQSSYFASEAQGFMTVTLISSLPVDFPYSIIISMEQSTPVSAAGTNLKQERHM